MADGPNDQKKRRKSSEPVIVSTITNKAENSSNINIMDSLANLSSWSRPTRLDSARALIEQLLTAQNGLQEAGEDLKYVVDRVTFGLASGQDAVRQGFAMVLAELLQLFPFLSVEEVLNVVDTKMVHAQVDDEKQLYFGRVFAVIVILRSGRLAGITGSQRTTLLQRCVSILVTMMEKKSYLAELCAHSIVELLQQLKDASEYETVVATAPLLSSLLKCSPEDCTPEVLAILLMAQQRFHVDPSHAEWGRGDLLKPENLRYIQEALKTSSASHPRMHFVWKLVVDRAFAIHAQQSLWDFIDQSLFASHVDNRKYLGFLLMIEFIQRATTAQEVIGFLVCPHSSKALVNNWIQKKKSKMGAVAVLAMEALTKRVSASPELGLALLNGASTPASPLHALHSLDLPQFVIPILDAAQANDCLVKMLRRAVAGGVMDRASGELLFTTMRRGWKKWVSEEKEGVAALVATAKHVSRVFARLAFMEGSGATLTAEYQLLQTLKDPVDAEGRQWAKQRLYSLLAELEVTGHCDLLELVLWVAGGKGDVAKALKSMRKAAKKYKGDDRHGGAFIKVMGIVALPLIDADGDGDDDGVSEDQLSLCSDVTTALKEFRNASSVSARNKAVLVLVSILIQLLTVSSLLHRQVVSNAFRMIAPVVPATGIKDIVNAIVSKEGEGEEEEEEEDGEGDADEDEDDEQDDHEHHQHQHHDHNDDDESFSDIEGGVELPSIPIDEADPEYLKLVEEKLAAVFRAMKEESKAKKEAVQQDMDFKLRVVDLLESFARGIPRIATMDPPPFSGSTAAAEDDNRATVFVLLPALVEKLKKTQNSQSLQVFNQKLTRVVTNAICEVRDWPSMVAWKAPLNEALGKVLGLVTQGGNPTPYTLQMVERVVSFLVKVLSKESLLDTNVLYKGFEQALAFASSKKNLNFNTNLFLLEIWKRAPEAGLQVLPRLAQQSGSASWSQATRLRLYSAMADLVTKYGKAVLIKDAQLALPAVQSVERVLVSWLRFEVAAQGDKVKPTQLSVLATNLSLLLACIRGILLDERVCGVRYSPSNVREAFPLRDEMVDAMTKLLTRYPVLSSSIKVQKEWGALKTYIKG